MRKLVAICLVFACAACGRGPAHGQLTGRVLDSDGSPVAGARVLVTAMPGPSPAGTKHREDQLGTGTTRNDGSFAVALRSDAEARRLAAANGGNLNLTVVALHGGKMDLRATFVRLTSNGFGRIRPVTLRLSR